jgi:hypothetical protein
MKQRSASHAAQVVWEHAVVGEVHPAFVVRRPRLENAAERGVIRRGSLGCRVGIVEDSSYDLSGAQLWPGHIKVFARDALQDTKRVKSRQTVSTAQGTKRSYLQDGKSVRCPFLHTLELVQLLQPVLEQVPRATCVAPAATLARAGCDPVDRVEVQRVRGSSIICGGSGSVLLAEASRMRPMPAAQHGVFAVERGVHAQIVVLQVSQADALVCQAAEHVQHAGHVVAERCKRQKVVCNG